MTRMADRHKLSTCLINLLEILTRLSIVRLSDKHVLFDQIKVTDKFSFINERIEAIIEKKSDIFFASLLRSRILSCI